SSAEPGQLRPGSLVLNAMLLQVLRYLLQMLRDLPLGPGHRIVDEGPQAGETGVDGSHDLAGVFVERARMPAVHRTRPHHPCPPVSLASLCMSHRALRSMRRKIGRAAGYGELTCPKSCESPLRVQAGGLSDAGARPA